MDQDSGIIEKPLDGTILAGHAKDDVAAFVFRDFFQELDRWSVKWFCEVAELVFAAVP